MDRVAKLLEGAVDLHVHPAPSPMPRRIDAAEAAHLAGEAGFRAIVVKSHHHNTVMDVLALEHAGAADGGARLYGGIALNGQVGGINPRAVELCLKMGGKIVWFPTIASAKHIEHHAAHPNLRFPKLSTHLEPEEPVEVLDVRGAVRPEVIRVLEAIKENDAILASGHMAPEQITAVFEAAHEIGVKRMLVNHPNFVIEASYDDARHWVELGAVIEHSILGSDLGQMNNPLPTESFRKIVGRLLERGMPEDQVRSIVARNAAELLGVE